MGSIKKPANQSKGSGGVMRIAPIGLYFEEGAPFSAEEIDLLGAEAAALTHGHELGYLPAAAMVHIVRLAVRQVELSDAVRSALEAVKKLFPAAKHLDKFVALLERAIELSGMDISDQNALRELGEGWVAEETLAVAVYCALKYQDDFELAVEAAVNHDGDSDTTGAVTGNIMGARLGMQGIPQKFLDNLELRDVILRIADALYENRIEK